MCLSVSWTHTVPSHKMSLCALAALFAVRKVSPLAGRRQPAAIPFGEGSLPTSESF